MFTLKREKCSNKGDNSKFIFARIVPLLGLSIFNEILISFFNRSLHLHVGILLNLNMTRGHTFKIKGSYSQVVHLSS